MENILSGNPLLNYAAAGQKNDLKVFFVYIFWCYVKYFYFTFVNKRGP